MCIMGFGGSALAANQVIRNNRAMLKKRRKIGKLSLVSDVNEQWEDPKTATSQQLMEIRKRVIRGNKIRMRKVLLLALAGLVMICAVFAIIPWEIIFKNMN